MLTAKKALAASRVYTQETAIGMGALKGANCTIKSITKTGDLNTVIFEWTDTEGGKHENTMLVYDGAPGTPGHDGDDGFSPTITVKTATSSEYVLTITDKNGSYDTPNLKGGGGGGGGASSLSDLDDIALSSLANGDVLVYDSTAGKWKNIQLDIPTQLSDLSDIDLASLADADILKYDFASQKWVNGKLDYSELTGTPTLGTAAAKDSTNAVTQGSSELLESGGAYTALDGKVDKVTGKGLSTNDFTDAEKQKLDNMELDDLADVDMTGITDGQVLAWDDANSKFVPADNTGEEYTAGMGIDISAQNKISTEFIMYPGTKAEWDQLPVSEKIKYTHTAWNDSQSGIVDNLPTQNSDNLVKSGGVWTGLDAKADKTALTDYQTKDLATPITVDGTSETTVEGALGAINTLAAGNKTDKADKVSSATNGNFAGLDVSGNLTDSGKKASDFATAQGLADEVATRSALGAKNILPFVLADIKALNTNGTWAGNVYTYRGVDFTVNSDGTISASGTATGGNASIKIFAASSNYEMLGKEVILTGCPSNGSATTYRIQAYRMASADGSTGTYFDDGEGTDAFTALNNASGTVGSFAVAVYENATVTNLLFKPMVRLASDPDATYQPYAKTNKELTDDSVDWYSNGIIGAKNLIPFPYPKESDTVLGIVFTTNSNGEIIASGTSTGIAVYDVVNTELYGWNVPREGAYILSDGLSDADYEYAYTAVTFMYNDGTIEYNVGDTSIGRTVITIPSNLKNFYVGCCIRTDKTVSNIKFKPMLRMIEDSDETFRLYAKTNRELTVDSVSWDDASNTGSVNMLDNIATTTVSSTSGLTATVNKDKTITVAPTSGTYPYTLPQRLIVDLTKAKPDFAFFPCKLSGCPSGGSLNAGTGYQIYYANYVDTDGMKVDAGDGAIITEEFNRTTYPNARIMMRINAGVTLEGPLTFKPMLTPVDYNGPYVPYAMTNRQFSAYESGNITYSIQATETAMTTIIKLGKVVQCNMMAAIGEAVSAWTTFATIPEGFRPATYVQAVNNKTMYTGFNIIQISPQGTVQSASALASGDRLRFTAVWILP